MSVLVTIPNQWETALSLLTHLPLPHGDIHGDVNFMCAGRFRQNGHRLFREKITPLLEQGRKLTVLFGFVDANIARITGYGADDKLLNAASEFRAARLYDIESHDTFELVIDQE